jgi:hypothetical protein
MASRVTEQDVLDIMDSDLTLEQIRPHLDAATVLVDDTLVTDRDGNAIGYSDAMLAEIEKRLAGHFATVTDPEITRETIGEAEAYYATLGTMGGGFEASSYGKQAMVLEHKGILKEISTAKETVSISVVELDLENET